jgi:site-specific recombinase XerD
MKILTAVTNYVAYRRALGESFSSSERNLKYFARLVGKGANVSDVRTELVDQFLIGKGELTASWFVKHNTLSGLYNYLISRGLAKRSPLPVDIPKRPPVFVPYIYTKQELGRLLQASYTYQKNRSPYEPNTIRTLLLFLYGTGMRLKEAISLLVSDVDLKNNLLTVRNTKFNKTRFVPIGRQLTSALALYASTRQEADTNTTFFVTLEGKPLIQSSVEDIFQRIREHVSVCRQGGPRKQPRLHDLRHTFAVHRLTSWYKQGADVQKLLPVLSVYLGHSKLASTSVYLTMTPALLNQANKRFANYALGENFHE